MSALCFVVAGVNACVVPLHVAQGEPLIALVQFALACSLFANGVLVR